MKTYNVCLGKRPQLDNLRREAAVAGKCGEGGRSQEATEVVVLFANGTQSIRHGSHVSIKPKTHR